MRFLRSGVLAVVLAVLCLAAMGAAVESWDQRSEQAQLNLQASGFTAVAVPAPEGEDSDWGAWYEVSFTLHNSGQESLNLDAYQFDYELRGSDDYAYPYQGDAGSVLEYRPILPVGRSCTVTQTVQVYGGHGGDTLAVTYDSWRGAARLGEVTLPGHSFQ